MKREEKNPCATLCGSLLQWLKLLQKIFGLTRKIRWACGEGAAESTRWENWQGGGEQKQFRYLTCHWSCYKPAVRHKGLLVNWYLLVKSIKCKNYAIGVPCNRGTGLKKWKTVAIKHSDQGSSRNYIVGAGHGIKLRHKQGTGWI